MRDAPTLVPLTPDDLHNFCYDMASELYHDMTLSPGWKGLSEDDFAGILKAWREQSPWYVSDRLNYFKRARAHGFAGSCESRRSLEEARAMHDATAERLGRMLPFLAVASAAN